MNKRGQLEEIAREVAKCQKCSLYKNTTNPVPGEGNPEAEIMFIGEGPGYWEDQKGIPFCGQAGKLLDELLLSIKVARKDIFITNIVKHRPPNNRDPLPDEIRACKEFLDKQIEIIQPKIIVTLGRFSLEKFLLGARISQIHGQPRFVEFGGRKIIVIPMFHPAAALRGAKVLQMLREDFSKIPKFLGEIKEKIPKISQENLQDNQLQLI